MKNDILQFLKRQRLAISLARSGLTWNNEEIPSLSPLQTIGGRLFFRGRAQSLLERIREFLNRENDEILNIFADEAYGRFCTGGAPLYPAPDSGIPAGPFCLCRALDEKTRKFYEDLSAELPRDLIGWAVYCSRRWNLRRDMRLYAADWQEMFDMLRGSAHACLWEIDWTQTSAGCLWIRLPEAVRITSRLNYEEQKHLAALWGELFFDKACFVASWSGVAVDSSARVIWSDFDALYQAYPELQSFALRWLRGEAEPAQAIEFKLCAALRRLRFFSPDIDLLRLWQNYLPPETKPRPLGAMTEQPSFRQAMRQSGMDFLPREKIESRRPEDVRYLLDSSRHRKDPRFRKSSILYWLPLVIAIYILLKYF